eukprot:2643689-Pleurochrysis_carterae.AAC.2
MRRQTMKSRETHASCSASWRRTKSSRERFSAGGRFSTGTWFARRRISGRASRTNDESRSRCFVNSRNSACSSATAALHVAMLSSATSASASRRKAQRATLDVLYCFANSSASICSRECMSRATFERASGWARVSKPRAEAAGG